MGISSSAKLVRGVGPFSAETTRFAARPKLVLRVVPEAAVTVGAVAVPIADFRLGILDGEACGIGRGAVAAFSEGRPLFGGILNVNKHQNLAATFEL